MHRALYGVRRDDAFTSLILEQVDRVRRMVPEQMIGPGTWLAFGVDVLATEEIRLHIHLLYCELAGIDLVAYPLVRRIESARMPAHADEARLLLNAIELLSVGPTVGNRNLDFDMLTSAHALDRLRRVHLSRRTEYGGLNTRQLERFGKIG